MTYIVKLKKNIEHDTDEIYNFFSIWNTKSISLIEDTSERIILICNSNRKKNLFISRNIYFWWNAPALSLDQWSRWLRGEFIGCCCSAIAPSAAVRQVSPVAWWAARHTYALIHMWGTVRSTVLKMQRLASRARPDASLLVVPDGEGLFRARLPSARIPVSMRNGHA